MIKAIETTYKGYKFRSRLEARWAVFFDGIGVKWSYEVEGFNLDGINYLPDFEIYPTLFKGDKIFVEIKPNREITPQEEIKAKELSRLSGKIVLLFSGDPYDYFNRNLEVKICNRFLRGIKETPYFCVEYFINLLSFLGIMNFDQYKHARSTLKENDKNGIEIAGSYMGGILVLAISAALKARSARFEFNNLCKN